MLTVSPVFLQSCPGIILSVFDSKAPLVMGVFVGTGALLVSKRVACCTFPHSNAVNEVNVSAELADERKIIIYPKNY